MTERNYKKPDLRETLNTKKIKTARCMECGKCKKIVTHPCCNGCWEEMKREKNSQ